MKKNLFTFYLNYILLKAAEHNKTKFYLWDKNKLVESLWENCATS